MKSGKNRTKLVFEQKSVSIGKQIIHPDDYIRGDASGVIIIPQDRIQDVIDLCIELERVESRILISIKNGMSLEQARKENKYNDFAFSKEV